MITAIIIDDEPAAIKTLQLMLERYAPDISIIYTSSDPASVTEKIKTLQPELIFLDIQMPIMNGYKATTEIRKTNQNTIIIAITAGIITGEKEKCLEVGMNDFIIKPVDKILFETTLFKWINSLPN